jgi:NAD(P)-dependent dehydrogenase (short-subunit alcohol dehydrogenase family)
MMMNLSGQTAVVTGAGPNINAGIARGLGEAGATVACLDLRQDYVDACVSWLQGLGCDALGVICDVTQDVQVEEAIDRVLESTGRVDILVNAAGLHKPAGILNGTSDLFRFHLETILVGAYSMTRRVAREMVNGGAGGSIINLLSTEAHQGNPMSSGYGAAKSGLWGLTRSAAMELAPYGIRVNSVTPTGTDPDEGIHRAREWGVDWGLTERANAPEDFSRGDVGVPLGRRPGPRDYADAVVFLASSHAGMVTGADLRVDGGVLARYWRWNPGGAGPANRDSEGDRMSSFDTPQGEVRRDG